MSDRYVVRGLVLDRSDYQGIDGCRVEAWDASQRVGDLILYARTDADGAFLMELTEEDKLAIFGDRTATLYFRVFDGTTANVIFEERAADLWVLNPRPAEARLITSAVLTVAESGLASAVVRGRVSGAAGGVSGAHVAAYDDTMGTLTLLGASVTTDARGRYRITYDPAALPNGKQHPDLVVKAFSDSGLMTQIAASGRRCRAPAMATVDLVKAGERWSGPSAYRVAADTVQGLLGSAPGELTEEEREQLSCSTRLPRSDVDALVGATKLASTSNPLSVELAFGLLRRGVPEERGKFFLHSKRVVRQQLRAALDENIVPQTLEASLEALLDSWTDAAATWALEPRATGKCGLYEVLTAAGVTSSADQQSFATAYCDNEQPLEEFWSGLEALSSSQRDDVKLALQWWSLARGHKPLLDYLAANKATYPTLEDLCALSEEGWRDILTAGGVGAPSSIPTPGDLTAEDAYARVLALTIATAFPTKTFAARAGAASGEAAEIKAFFTANGTFEFGRDRLSKPSVNKSMVTTPANQRRLAAMERLFRVAPRYEPVGALVDKGYTSALSIQQRGRGRFVSEMQALLGGQIEAEDIFWKATWQAGAANAVISKFGGAMNPLHVHVLPSSAAWGQVDNEYSDLSAFFGGESVCACQHCSSVLGPAAYLTDLLQWLDGFPSTVEKEGSEGMWSALDILVGNEGSDEIGRRPDLRRLELTCKSAHTSLPYIDLVNEIMEVVVATDASGSEPALTAPIKTSYSEEDLLAGPEIIHPDADIGAWKAINGAKHPFTMPVDLWMQEANAHLAFLGVSRADVIKALPPPEGPDSFETYESALAKSRLGVRSLGYSLLKGGDVANAAEAWGVEMGSTPGSLKPVPAFLKQSGLTFGEFEELLATRYVNGELAISPSAGCDVQEMQIPALTDPHLLRIHRFLRLRHRTGLSITDLDRLLAAFPSVQIDEEKLRSVTRALALAERLSLSVSDVAALYAPLDAREAYKADSPFRRVFLDRRAESPDLAVWTTLLTSGPDDAAPDMTVNDQRATLLQALSLSAKELDLLTDSDVLSEQLKLHSSKIVLPKDAPLTRSAVSRLYRVVLFARAVGLSVADFLVVRAHISDDWFPSMLGDDAEPHNTEDLCDIIDDIRSQRMSAAEIQYVLRGVAREGSGLAPSDAAIQTLCDEFTKLVESIEEGTKDSDDSDGIRTEALLTELLEESDVNAVLATLRGPPPLSPSSLDKLERFMDEPIAVVKAKLAGAPPGFPDPELGSASQRFAYVVQRLEHHVRSERCVVEKLAATYALPVGSVHYLLNEIIKTTPAATPERAAIDYFLPARRGEAGADERRKKTLRLLDRHARLLRGLNIGEPVAAGPNGEPAASLGELAWVYHYIPELSWPSLDSLPDVEPVSPSYTTSTSHFIALRNLARRVALRDRLPGGPGALLQYYEEVSSASDLGSAKDLLAKRTGWDKAALDVLVPHFWPDGEVAVLRRDVNLLILERALSLVERLGVAAGDALALVDLDAPEPTDLQTPNDPRNARDVVMIARRAAKAKLSSEAWARVARGIRDPFREELRDALLSYLVPKVYGTVGEAFGMLLIDPEMSPCQLTSRVVQATNSVQAFVQRSFLDLDDQVKLPPEAGKQWEWRKAYRLWEANRKIFLYPESWIEAELRDDKTPLFKALEARLMQGELTEATAERALEGYLSGLAEVARLEVSAVYYDEETNTDHVVARTRSNPHKYFYRKRERGLAWTPWEAMGLDIDSDGLLLVQANRRIYLFWPSLIVRPTEEQPTPGSGGGVIGADKRFDIRVAWSSFVDGAWTPRQLSDCAPLVLNNARGEDDKSGVTQDRLILVAVPGAQVGEVKVGVVVSDLSANTYLYRIGDFTFIPCAGGRWTSEQMKTKFDYGQIRDYFAAWPLKTIFRARGILEDSRAEVQPVALPRYLPGGESATSLTLFDDHPMRHYRIVLQSNPSEPHFTYDRLAFEDGERTLYVRVERTERVDWINPAKISAGQRANVYPAADKSLHVYSAITTWADTTTMDAPQPNAEDACYVELFDHRFACVFARALAANGVSGLYRWTDPEGAPQFLRNTLTDEYGQSEGVEEMPVEDVDFTYGGAYAAYNWELFFHVPFFVAERLRQEGRYEEARRWYHYIFDPTRGSPASGAKRYWLFRPFYENEDLATIQQNLTALAEESSTAAEVQALVDQSAASKATIDSLKAQILAMQEDPFNPHAIARHRILAYQKKVVMRYIDNLLDWGDALFRRDTLESNHEALNLYLLAADILGPRPEVIKHKDEPAGKTFEGLRALGLDGFSNAAIEVEPLVLPMPPGFQPSDEGIELPNVHLYFCVPHNEEFVAYWDRVADRLFKLRNCMNIDGVVRQLPLFAPPIDPALLVKAAAAGVSLDKVLDALAAPAPLFRFLRLHAKAVEFAAAVLGLGQSLLSALEKRDGEALVRLRQTHELALLEAEREVRKSAIKEASEALSGLRRQKSVVQRREEFYGKIIDRIPEEKEAKRKAREALRLKGKASEMERNAQIVSYIPEFMVGIAGLGGSPQTGLELGGKSIAFGMSLYARSLRDDAEREATEAEWLVTEAGYRRRSDEWRLQAELARLELAQIDKQIVAQEIRVAIAELELRSVELRASQSREVDAMLRSKFTSQELYDWMVGQLAAEHYRAYQTAYDIAKKAERAYQLEIGDGAKTFVRFGAWDSLKKGLLAGERLLQDLRALDAAYLSRAEREREIIKHVSLAQLAQASADAAPYLVQLRDTGVAEGVKLPEALFDADYPGHYFRRLKAVSVTVSTVKPSHDGVQCELTLSESVIRTSPRLVDGKGYKDQGPTDDRFVKSPYVIKALSTSSAEDDAGMFQLDLRDEKLLPFEGSGAISTWTIEVPRETNRFPLHKISDVVLHLRYTSRDGGQALRSAALNEADTPVGDPPVLVNRLKQRVRVISARGIFHVQWAKFVKGNEGLTANELELPIASRHFWSFFGESRVQIVKVEISATFAKKYNPPDPLPAEPEMVDFKLRRPDGEDCGDLHLPFRRGEPSVAIAFGKGPLLAPVKVLSEDDPAYERWVLTVSSGEEPSAIRSSVSGGAGPLKSDALEDIWIHVTYEQVGS
jgi:hypothetical protein